MVPVLMMLARPSMSPPCPSVIRPEFVTTLALSDTSEPVLSNSSIGPLTVIVPEFLRIESALRLSDVPMVSDAPPAMSSSGAMLPRSSIVTDLATAFTPSAMIAG